MRGVANHVQARARWRSYVSCLEVGEIGYQPEKRASHCTVRVKDYLYLWSGFQISTPKVHNSPEKISHISCIELFHLPTGKWEQKPTTGNPPLAIIGYTATASGDEIFYFGGGCGEYNCYSNSLNCLNANTLNWKELSPKSIANGYPSLKYESCMIPLMFPDEQYLVVIGGNCQSHRNTPRQLGAEYGDHVHSSCNEIHYYNLTTGQWISPQVIGERPPPCSGFTLTSITDTSAIMFGGRTPTGPTNNVYTVIFTKSSVTWTLMCQPPLMKCPQGRGCHSSVLIHDTSSRPHLLVVGGYRIDDSWLLDIERVIWREMSIPAIVTRRWRFSLSVWNITPDTSFIIAFGGRKNDWSFISDSCTAVIEIRFNEWSIDSCALTHYEQKVKQRRQESEGNPTIINNPSDDKETSIVAVKGETGKGSHDKTQTTCSLEEGSSHIHEKVSTHQLEQKELLKLLQKKDEQIENLMCQIRERDEEIKRYREVKQSYTDQQPHLSWTIKREEVITSDQVIGKGGWGEVRIAHYCGLKVAAKCLHEVLLSTYNISVFSNEMEIAAKIRHPNLLQFIGATREGNPIILSELMPTSLRKELETGSPLPYHAVLNISLDVACALNYLHLFRPHPILHRDVSSANVLLQPMGGGWKAKLSDYGSANLQNLVSRTSNPGNPVYSSPESPYPRLHSPAMDVYSYGILLLEMIINCIPVPSERIAHINSIKRPAYKHLIESCLKEERELRPTMTIVIEQLNEFI